MMKFLKTKVLEDQVKNCLAINHIKSVSLPEEGQYVNFQNFERLIKPPFITYGDFECVLIPSTDIGQNT